MSTPIIPQITPKELKARMDAGEDLFLLDVREPHERDICNIGGELIPKDTVTLHLERIPKDKEVVVYCRSGGRSDWVARELVGRHGYSKVANLAGGMLRWSDDVDPSCKKY
jgi:rhodanese-related sulfurtransferase